jgi:hypothetical protein
MMYATWNYATKAYELEQGTELQLLPVSKRLQQTWREAYRAGRCPDIEWEWKTPGSMPAAEDAGDDVAQLYDQVRETIKLGERMFPQGAKSTDQAMRRHQSGWKETYGLYQTSKALRNGHQVEFEAFFGQDVADGLQQAWKRPMHWAGFLVMGANTCLPRGGLGRQKKAEEWSVAEVCEMVRGIGFADAAKILEENCIDGKTLCSADFDCFFTMDVGDGGLGLKPMQKARLKKEIDNAT